LAFPNRGGVTSAYNGTHVPVDEPFKASKATEVQSCAALQRADGQSLAGAAEMGRKRTIED
jgi:hypothetical protein